MHTEFITDNAGACVHGRLCGPALPLITIPMQTTHALSLRPATLDDAALIASIHSTSWQATYRGLLPDAFLDGEVTRERAAYWEARLSAPGGERRIVLIAELGGRAGRLRVRRAATGIGVGRAAR